MNEWQLVKPASEEAGIKIFMLLVDLTFYLI
jgi:hypothetical protein